MYSRLRGRVQPTNVTCFANTLLIGTAQLPRPVKGPTAEQTCRAWESGLYQKRPIQLL